MSCLFAVQKIRFFLEDNENVTRVSQRTSYVVSQYKGYARRCSRSRGVMWLRITRAKHDLIADRVLNGLLDGVAPRDRTGIMQLLDWGSGCGPTLSLYSKLFGGAAGFRAIGIERIPEAVEWARTFSVAPGVVHCNADGTKLDWLPEASFDFIISYGGIVHLPLARLCPTLQQLLRLLMPGGRMWFGYIHIKEAFEHLLSCSINCSGDASEVVVQVVDEVAWWKDINLHPSYTISKPKSLLWEKRV